jgi:hypothetical protein
MENNDSYVDDLCNGYIIEDGPINNSDDYSEDSNA